LAHFLVEQRLARHRRNQAMVEQLRSLGYQLTLEQLVEKGQGVVGRMQAAQLLTDLGHTASTAEAFEKVLGFGKPGYVERPRPSLAEAVWQIRRCGGVPVLAHPALYRWCSGSTHVSDRLIHHLTQAKAKGLLGVEAYHGEASPAIWQEVAAAGRFLGLLCTAGSDDHGSNKVNTTIYTGERQFLAARELLVVGALVSREDRPGKPRYLLARRSSAGHGRGLWELPGGKVEPGESPEAALIREIEEELHAKAAVGPLRRLLIHNYEGFRVILACYEVHLDTLSFRLSAHDKTSWRTAHQALRMKLLAADVGLFRELSQL
jgi:mutator protein MutT